ncbi:MAG: hypothetical protein KIS87_03570 [Phycisphaeraceae bacterium]|nr:hypothetical protein [Phycisphaeraceae bacterium]
MTNEHFRIRRRKGGSPNVADLDVDTSESHEARVLLRQRRPDELDQVVRKCTEPNQRTHLAEALGDWAGDAPWVAQWRERSPTAFARTAHGIWQTKRAWDFSPWTHGRTDMSEFRTRLESARDELLTAARMDSRCAAPLPWLMWCARGLGDPDLSAKAFGEGTRRSPSTKLVYSSSLLSESTHWFGEVGQALEAARGYARSAPHGIGAASLVIEAHLGVDPQFGAGAGGYWRSPAVRDEVVSAASTCDAEGFHGINGVRTRYWLAFGLWKVGEHAAAAPHFRSLGAVWNQNPWFGMRILNRLLNPYYKARKQCLSAG